jgi:hypothetical protein
MVGPYLAIGVSGVQIYRDGDELVAVYGSLEQARGTGAVTGFAQVAALEDKRDAAVQTLVISAGAGLADVTDAVLTLRAARASQAMVPAPDAPAPRPAAGLAIPADQHLVPAGARAVVRDLDQASAAAVLRKLDGAALRRYRRDGQPGDAAFFRGAGLAPQRSVEAGGRRYHLSRPFLGPEGRPAVIAFEETPAGTFVPRTFYLSGEHGLWRAATGIGGLIAKGPSQVLDPLTGKALSQTQFLERGGGEWQFVNEAAVDLAAELQPALGRWYASNTVLALPEEQMERAFRGHLEEAFPAQDPQEFAQWVKASDVDRTLPNDLPDVRGGPLDQWTFTHHVYGEVDGFLYPSRDGKLIFTVLRDGRGWVWVPSIQDATASLTPFGTRARAYQGGALVATPAVNKRELGVPDGSLPKGYYRNPGYANPLNEGFGTVLAPPNQVGDFRPIGSFDDLQRPPAPQPTLAEEAQAARAVQRAQSAEGTRAAAHAATVVAHGASVVDHALGQATVDPATLGAATDRKIQEVLGHLRQRNLPTTVAELDALLKEVPANFKGGNWDEVQKLREALDALEKKQKQVSARPPAKPAPASGAAAPPAGAAVSTGQSGYNAFIPPINFKFVPILDEKTGVAEEKPQEEPPPAHEPLPVERENLVSWAGPLVGDALGLGELLAPNLNFPPMPVPDPLTQKMVVDSVVDELHPARVLTRAYPPPSTTAGGYTLFFASATPAVVAPPSAASAVAGLKMFFSSLGTSTGEAFELHVVGRGPMPRQLRFDGLVVEPLKKEARGAIEREVRRLAGATRATARLDAYCLEFTRLPPTRDMVFQVAGADAQRKFAPMRSVLRASRRLRDAGALTPDSDPRSYFHSIRQWSVWTKEQSFDQKGYADAFVKHTRKNLEGAGGKWAPHMDQALRGVVPGRWRDIQRILAEAAGAGRP